VYLGTAVGVHSMYPKLYITVGVKINSTAHGGTWFQGSHIIVWVIISCVTQKVITDLSETCR